MISNQAFLHSTSHTPHLPVGISRNVLNENANKNVANKLLARIIAKGKGFPSVVWHFLFYAWDLFS